jgi:serine/threonine protein kinase
VIHFDDLVAARILNRQLPQQRSVLLASLDSLRDGERQAGLLADLVNRRVLTWDQARFVHETVERDKEARATSVYAQLLVSRGVEQAGIRQCMARTSGGVNALGKAIVAAGLFPPDVEQQIRFHARQLNDRDRAQQVRAYLSSRPQADRQSTPDLPPDSSISGVIKLPETITVIPVDSNAALPTLNAEAEACRISAVHIPRGRSLAPPAFEVPEFVDTSDPIAGARINQYRILGRIGAGAMGIVYLADAPDDPTRPVAIKVLNDSATEDAKGRFKREILANSFFSHPGAIDIYDAGETPGGNQFLAMEFLDSQDLEEILESESQLDPAHALLVCRQVFDVLGAAHEAGIVHRDVKPANILISRDGERAKLMDFGVAILKDLGEFEHMVFQTIEGGATGTPQYMSPEQAAGDAITPSSDLYSMALVLYVCLSGRLPYESETASGFMACHMLEDPIPLAKAGPGMKALPKELHELLASLFDKNPRNRPPNAAAVVACIDTLLPKISEKKGGLFGMFWKGR